MRMAIVAGVYLALGIAAWPRAEAEVFREDFNENYINPLHWTAAVYGTGPQMSAVNQRLEIGFPAWSSGGDFGAKLSTNFLFRGDFDVQVDFQLLTWPFGNGVRTALGIDWGFLYPPGVERLSFGQSDYGGEPRESYLTDLNGVVCGITGTSDMAGSLRLVRTGSTLKGYRYSGGWVLICVDWVDWAPTDDVRLQISAFTAYQFSGWTVLMAFDNFVVNSGELIDFSTAVQGRTWGAIKALY